MLSAGYAGDSDLIMSKGLFPHEERSADCCGKWNSLRIPLVQPTPRPPTKY